MFGFAMFVCCVLCQVFFLKMPFCRWRSGPVTQRPGGVLRAYIFPEVTGRGGGGACTDLLAECLPVDAHLRRSAKRWVRAPTP